MTRAEEDARVRELKRLIGGFGGELEANKQRSRVACYYGKHDRKRAAFRAYEEQRSAYRRSKEQLDIWRAELLMLQERARKRHNDAPRRRTWQLAA